MTTFEDETTIVGYPKVRLWVEADGADDMDLFVLVQKIDRNGTPLQQFNVPNNGALMHDFTEQGASVLRYKGSNGRLRVSARHLDEVLTTDAVPAHSFDRVEKLTPGEIVEVEIDLFPIGLVFYPGEQLRLVISGHNALGAIMPGTRDYIPQNKGMHVIHTGADHTSYLQLPCPAARRGVPASPHSGVLDRSGSRHGPSARATPPIWPGTGRGCVVQPGVIW